jgi:hypothetical protein
MYSSYTFKDQEQLTYDLIQQEHLMRDRSNRECIFWR